MIAPCVRSDRSALYAGNKSLPLRQTGQGGLPSRQKTHSCPRARLCKLERDGTGPVLRASHQVFGVPDDVGRRVDGLAGGLAVSDRNHLQIRPQALFSERLDPTRPETKAAPPNPSIPGDSVLITTRNTRYETHTTAAPYNAIAVFSHPRSSVLGATSWDSSSGRSTRMRRAALH